MNTETTTEPLTDDALEAIRSRVESWREIYDVQPREHMDIDVLLAEVDRLRLMTCDHPEIELGNCVVCSKNVPQEDTDLRYTPEPRQIYPREVLSANDFDVIYELVGLATERREQQARSDIFEASYHRSRIEDYRKFYAKLRR